jgi:hypothetical protein
MLSTLNTTRTGVIENYILKKRISCLINYPFLLFLKKKKERRKRTHHFTWPEYKQLNYTRGKTIGSKVPFLVWIAEFNGMEREWDN